MDLSKIDIIKAADRGFDYTFIIPEALREDEDEDDDGKTDIVVSVVGIGSRIHKQAQAEYNAEIERLKKSAYKGKIDPEIEDELKAKLIAKCTTGWKNVQDSGKDVPWSLDNAVDIFLRYPLLQEGVAGALFEIKAMLKNV
jgi:hypothetical protein